MDELYRRHHLLQPRMITRHAFTRSSRTNQHPHERSRGRCCRDRYGWRIKHDTRCESVCELVHGLVCELVHGLGYTLVHKVLYKPCTQLRKTPYATLCETWCETVSTNSYKDSRNNSYQTSCKNLYPDPCGESAGNGE